MLIVALLSSGVGQVFASSITITGTIETKRPTAKVDVTTEGELIAFVKRFEATTASDASGCRLVESKALAVAGTITGAPVCLIEWGTIDGVSQVGIDLSGYPQASGNQVQTYQISYFSGSAQEKVVVSQGSISHNMLEPVAPALINARVKNNGETLNGFSNTAYNRSLGFQDLTLQLEPRNYEQHLSLDIGEIDQSRVYTCTVKPGESECSLPVNIRVGVDSTDLQGVDVYNIAYNSENDYFDAATHNVNYEFYWDYRPPFAERVIINASFDKQDLIEVINGNSYTIPHGEGLIVIGSPHIDMLDKDWWQPSNARINFIPNVDRNELEVTKVVNGNVLFRGRDLTWGDNYDITTYDDYSYTGESLVYKFKLDSVPDGNYDLQSAVLDSNKNGSERAIGEGSIHRDTPEIKLFDNFSEMSDGAPMYFMEHITVAGYNNYKQGVRIDSVAVDGQVVDTINGHDESVKYLTVNNFTGKLVPGSEYTIDVNATDMDDNSLVYSQKVIFAPVEYKLEGVDQNKFYDVSQFNIYLSSIEGKRCNPASDEAIAQRYGSRSFFACTIEWVSFPDGLFVDTASLGHKLHGLIKKDTSSKNIDYKINYHDGEGNTITVVENSVIFELQDASAPDIVVLPYEIIDENNIAVEVHGGAFGYSSVLSSPAAMELKVDNAEDNKDESYYFWKARPNRRDPSALQKGSAKLFADAGELWKTSVVDLAANYQLMPTFATEKHVNIVHVPPKRTYSYAWFDKEFGLTTEQLRVGARIGEFMRKEGTYDYSPEIHGEWNLTLERQISRREYEAVSEPVLYDGKSEDVYFNIDGGDWLGSNKLCVRADVITPIDGYARTIRSSCVRMAVFKGEGIEGELASRRMVGRVPFKMAATYKFTEKADRESSENIVWQISTDNGSSWEQYIPERKYKSSVRFLFEEPGKWLIRGIAKNRFTGIETTSNEIEVVAYDVPEIKIEGPSSVYTGEYAELTLFDEVTGSAAYGEIEWSIDGGDTWEPGTNSLVFDTSQVSLYKIFARMRYDDIDAEIERSWNKDLHYLKVNAPTKPSISIKGDGEVEVGKPITLKVTSRTTDRVVHYEWTLPDGSVVSDDEITYVMNDNDINNNIEYREFRVQAWLDGYKQETTTNRVFKVKAWQYTPPRLSLNVQTSVKYDPAFVRVTVKQDRQYAPGVDFNYELDINPSEVEILNQNNNVFDLKIRGVRTHQIKAYANDNRGNTVDAIDFVEVLSPEPLKAGINVRAKSNDDNREPLTLYLQATQIMPHKKDSIKSYEWLLNGEKLNFDDVAPNYWTIEDLPEGTHTITLKAVTVFGQTDEEVLTIDVVDNIKPVCTIEFQQTLNSLQFDSSCRDEDGSILRYEWTIDDDLVSINERVNYFKYPHLKDATSVVVTLRVYDNSFEYTEYSDTYEVTH